MSWIAWRFDIPSILLLLVGGLVVGPLTGWLDPDAVFGDLLPPLISISVALILFEGGLTLRVVELEEVGKAVRNLVTIGVVVTWALTTVAAIWMLGMGTGPALLLGAILVVTGPTVVLPLLRHLRPKGNVGDALKWEGILIDPIGVVLAVLVFEALLAGGLQDVTQILFITVGKALISGFVFGAIGGYVVYQMVRRHWLPDHLDSPITLGAVIAVFTACELVQAEAGLVGATVMGVYLANQTDIPKRHIVEFKENLRVLLISFLFIVLAARMDASAIEVIGWRSIAFLALLILVVRPISVIASTIGTDLSLRERTFLASMAPRGIVAAAISSVFALELAAHGVPGGEALVPITFLVIIGTVTVYGIGAGPVARLLGVGEPDPQGVLVVGASKWGCEFSEHLQDEGLTVLVADTSSRRLRHARDRSLDVYDGSLLTEYALEELDLGGIGYLVAATPNDETNALITISLRELFDRAHTFQLSAPGDGTEEDEGPPPDLHGRFLFDEEATFEELSRRLAQGWGIVTTELPSDWSGELAEDESRLPLAVLGENDQLEMFALEERPDLQAGDRLIQMVAPDADEVPPAKEEDDEEPDEAGGLLGQ